MIHAKKLLVKVSPCCKRFTREASTSKEIWESQSLPIYDFAPSKSKQKGNQYLYGWGLAASGALGVQEFVIPTPPRNRTRLLRQPHLLPFSAHFQPKLISAGYGFTLFTSGRRLIGCGLNNFGQLGFHPSRETGDKTMEWITVPRKIHMPIEANKTAQITGLASGRSHSLIATSHGIYSLGLNAHGQTGRIVVPDEDYSLTSNLHKINEIDGQAKKVVCGLDHSMVLMQDGRLFTFGMNTDGQLGNAEYLSSHVPTDISKMGDLKGENILDVNCSGDTVLAVSESGHVFGWGMAEYSQLGALAPQVNLPRRLDIDVGEEILEAVAGGSACALRTKSGLVYVWGYGILGQGPSVVRKSNPSLLPAPLFGATEFEPNVRVTKLFAGLMHFAAINTTGDLYTWGKNRFASLGLSHENDQYFPLRVSMAGTVSKVACSPSHMLVIATSNM